VSGFVPRSVRLEGHFPVGRPVAEVFEPFSPIGETLWVPGWSPELLYPPGVSWERGLIFRTREESGEAVWVVTHLDRTGREVEYHRVEPGRHVARVAVRCAELGPRETEVRTSYTYVGLSDHGNAGLAEMTEAAYDHKMRTWRSWIEEHFARPGSAHDG